MGLFDVFSKKKEDTKQNEFVFGVRTFSIEEGSENVSVYGNLKGTVSVGSSVYINNVGDDESNILLTVVLEIKDNFGKNVNKAKNCNVTLLIEKAKNANIKCGTVLYTGEIPIEKVLNAHLNGLVNIYMPDLNLKYIPEDETSLSITDIQEILWFFYLENEKNKEKYAEIIKSNQEAISAYTKLLIKKLLSVKKIYCVYNKKTKEPHLFNNVIKGKDGLYRCSRPYIRLITAALNDFIFEKINLENIEKIEINNENGKELVNFLEKSFYLNGAMGVTINNAYVVIRDEELVPKPDFSHLPEVNRPIANPKIMRWLLLMDQIDTPKTEDEQITYNLYFEFMSRELVDAKFLLPTKYEGDIIPGEEPNQVIIEKGSKMLFPIVEGKNGRAAIKIYTDWKHLYEGVGKDWKGMIHKIDNLINVHDCIINNIGDKGIYISREMYESIKKRNSV